ncbi:hypothetical protein SKAU_G00238520 [Synaphobranchus kaupii]|uniref:CASP8 and FADD-like apoptosis regulator n=1 Tax=Synaphobranchus kaupii TaxID=118154 RepID=A0A9Q1IU32_SYNKA|nr:hypothetical protein SKAU_G00238520 [Synaphobranchus kaupii]
MRCPSTSNVTQKKRVFAPFFPMYKLKSDLKRILRTNKKEVEGILGNGCHVSEYRVLMTDISEALSKEDLDSLIFLLSETLPRGRAKKSTSFLDIVVELEKLEKVSCEDLELIEWCLHNVRRVDLAKKVQRYRAGGQASLTGISVHRPIGKQQRPKDMSGGASFVSPGHHTMWQRMPKPQGQASLTGISVHRPIGKQQCPKDMSGGASFVSPGHHTMWQRMPKPQAPENIQFSVPETGSHNGQSSVEVYRMRAEPRGSCVIIDCVGSDGEMLEHTFSRLHFRVILCMWPTMEEVHSTLMEVADRDLQGEDAFVCCIISRATSTHLLATELEGPGLCLDTVRHLFSTEACPGLAGKPKLFFVQSYSVPRLQSHRGYEDEDLEVDGPTVESVPTDADVFWSLCRTSDWQLQDFGHKSVYLQALSAALIKGQRRKLNLLDVHTEVNAVIYEHNQRDPGETYSVSLQHTLRKTLFI